MEPSTTSPLFSAPRFKGLWFAGALANTTLWLEMLAGGLFTLHVTNSGLAVALVSAARSFPLLLTGAFIGVLSDAINRKRIVVAGLLVTSISSAVVCVLSLCGAISPWHLGLAALVSGMVYATEMPARRRMIAECAGDAAASRAVAVDSMTNYATRCIGPIVGGLAYERLGLSGAFGISAACSVVAFLSMMRIPYSQAKGGPLHLQQSLSDLRDAVAYARSSETLLILLSVSLFANLFGYSYGTLLAPLGVQVLAVSSLMVGVLAAAEPAGSLLCGVLLAVKPLGGPPVRWLAGGATVLFTTLIAVSVVGRVQRPLLPMLGILFVGGLGSAAYNIYQTTIVIAATPERLRSRVMGLVTVCIGTWPLGTVIAGLLSRTFGPLTAIGALGIGGLMGIAITAVTLIRTKPASETQSQNAE
ncbi:MFS transporter [Caballeronia sp. M23-90]